MNKLTKEQIETAAKKMAEVMDYPWGHMPELGRKKMRENAQLVLQSALASSQPSQSPVVPKDRMMLESVLRDLEISSWQCPQCGHAEECKTMDAASMLRGYLSTPPAAEQAPKKATDLSHRLREIADQQVGWKPLLTIAADEIDRYYGGMLAWKKTAEEKDAQAVEQVDAVQTRAQINDIKANFALAGQVNELSMLMRRLVHALNHVSPGNVIAKKAADYLKRNDLQGTPMRAEDVLRNSSDADAAQVRNAALTSFKGDDLEAVADSLETGYDKTVNVGRVETDADTHLESTTAYAARFIRAYLSALQTSPQVAQEDKPATNEWTLTVTGMSYGECKNMIESRYGSVMWSAGISYPASNVVAKIAPALPQPSDQEGQAGVFSELLEFIETFPELNTSNYNEDDVGELNVWGIELCQLADKVKAALTASQASAVKEDAAKWKQMAEFQYALRVYPENLDLGIGALDAYFKGWNYGTARSQEVRK